MSFSENKWEIKFEMRNLLDNHQFEQYELTDVDTESTFHSVGSRYFLAGGTVGSKITNMNVNNSW